MPAHSQVDTDGSGAERERVRGKEIPTRTTARPLDLQCLVCLPSSRLRLRIFRAGIRR